MVRPCHTLLVGCKDGTLLSHCFVLLDEASAAAGTYPNSNCLIRWTWVWTCTNSAAATTQIPTTDSSSDRLDGDPGKQKSDRLNDGLASSAPHALKSCCLGSTLSVLLMHTSTLYAAPEPSYYWSAHMRIWQWDLQPQSRIYHKPTPTSTLHYSSMHSMNLHGSMQAAVPQCSHGSGSAAPT